MKKILIAGLAIVLIFVVVGVIAEDKIPLEVRIKSVKGEVEVKSLETQWEKASTGMVLKEGAQISTGFGAEAELIMADNSVVVVYQLTQMKIDSFFREKAKVKTGLNLNIGKIRARVQKVGEELSDFNVVTPTSVVSVRGTGMDIFQSDIGTLVGCLENVLVLRDMLGRREVVRVNQESEARLGEVPASVIDKMQEKAKVDTAALGMTREEIKGRQTVDVPEVKPGEPGKSGSVI